MKRFKISQIKTKGNMLITHEIKKDIVIIKLGSEEVNKQLSGNIELDTENSHILDNLFDELIPKGFLNYLVDLQNISYIYFDLK